MLKVAVGYPAADHEAAILDKVEAGFDDTDLATVDVRAVTDVPTLQDLRATVRGVRMEEKVRRYVTELVRATRTMRDVSLGASPRAGIMLMLAAKAHAVIAGRGFATPDDVKSIVPAVLRHRLMLLPEVEVEGRTPEDCIADVVLQVEVPR